MLEALDIYELKLRKKFLLIIMGFDMTFMIEYMYLVDHEVINIYFILV